MVSSYSKQPIYRLVILKKIIMSAIFGTLLSFSSLFGEKIILENQSVLNEKAVNEIELIGNELYDKSAVFLGVVAIEKLQNGEFLYQAAKKYRNMLKNREYAFVMISKEDKQIDIYTSDNFHYFDKEQVLSPMPSKGTILPILTSKKGGANVYSAAIFNGYADMAEQIAKNKGITLEHSVGNTNRNFINVIRFIFYGTIVLVIVAAVYFKFRGKR